MAYLQGDWSVLSTLRRGDLADAQTATLFVVEERFLSGAIDLLEAQLSEA